MTPRVIAILGAATLLLAAIFGLYWKGRLAGAAHADGKVAAARARAVVSDLEAEGARRAAQLASGVSDQRAAAARAVVEAAGAAMKSEDANAPLDPSRARRLRDLDERLCDAPGYAGCAADRDAGGREAAVRAAPPAGRADAG